MKTKYKRIFSILLIILLTFELLYLPIYVAAEDAVEEGIENSDVIETVEEEDEFPDDHMMEPDIDTELEIEEVEFSDRDDYTENDVKKHLEEMDLVSENDYLELYIHNTTAEIAVRVKDTDQVWLSNPVDRDLDTVPSGENKSVLNSQVSLTYFHQTGQTNRMHSHDSVINEQFEIQPLDDGVKVIYTLGDMEKGIEMIPKRITRERFEEVILSKIDDESEREELKSRFEYVEEEDAYYPREVSFTSKIALEKTLALFEEIGYTEEELAIDNAEAEAADEEGPGKPRFVIPVQYQLDGDNLVVTVEGEEIEENEAYPIREIKILEFFGAANEFREGYTFVPDGSGALIYLNNEKVNYQPYKQRIYGRDGARFERVHREVSQDIRLPIFGMKQDDKAFIAIIEEGDAIASIEADIAGRLNSYNKVNTVFNLKEHGEITLTGGERASTITMFQNARYTGDIQIRYGFLAGDEANYAGMAAYYREYLINNDTLFPLDPEEDLPFYLELVGTILKRKTFLGIPYQSVQDITTFEEAEMILNELMDVGISNIKLRYSGWFNDSYKHKLPNKIKVDSEIGGKKGLEKFNEFLGENQINLYPDVAFLRVNRNSFGFSPARHASRFVTKRPAILYPYNPASFRRDTSKIASYVLSPSRLPDNIKGFLDDYNKFNINGLSLRDMGSELHSDFREKNVINREMAKEIVQEQFDVFSENDADILVEGGNAFVLPYVNHILYMPSSSSEFNLTDESIPFYQMVIHGYLDYALEPVNLSANQNVKYQLLKALETGSNIYFKWFYNDPSVIKETEFNDLISANYKIWFNDAVEMYQELNSILNEVRTETITWHEQIEEGVYQTTYSNGTTIIVNYNDEEVIVNGMTIGPTDYVIDKGGMANVSEK